MRAFMMIQEVGSHQLPEIWKQLQKFVSWWPKMVQYPTTDGGWRAHEPEVDSSDSSRRFGKEKDLQKVCYTQSCRQAKKPPSHNLQNLIQTYLTSPHFLNCTVTEDASCMCQFAPNTKHQAIEWETKPSPRCKSYTCKNWGYKQNVPPRSWTSYFLITVRVYICFSQNSLLYTVISVTRCKTYQAPTVMTNFT